MIAVKVYNYWMFKFLDFIPLFISSLFVSKDDDGPEGPQYLKWVWNLIATHDYVVHFTFTLLWSTIPKSYKFFVVLRYFQDWHLETPVSP